MKLAYLFVLGLGLLTLTGCVPNKDNVLKSSYLRVYDYDEAVAYAKQSGKHLFITFTQAGNEDVDNVFQKKIDSLEGALTKGAVHLDVRFNKADKNSQSQIAYVRLAQKLGVGDTPAYVLTTVDGDIIKKSSEPVTTLALKDWFGAAPLASMASNISVGSDLKLMEAGKGGEHTRWEDAKAALAVGQIGLLFFTGSDWCPPCKQMKADVFDTAEWKKYQSENVQTVVLDFPKSKPLSAAQSSYNASLSKKYNITAFPTFVLVNADGKELDRKEGYAAGGPGRFADWITKARIKK